MPFPIQTEWVRTQAADGVSIDGYLALPPSGQGPGLLLLQEIFGVNPHIRSVAEQYALDGFVVLAPDVFGRVEPRVELEYAGEDFARGRAFKTALDPVTTMKDLEGALSALRARPEVAGRPVVAVGYCYGGLLGFQLAAQADLAAAVAYYGGGIQTQLHLAPQVRCPMQFHYAGIDEHIPMAAVDQVRAAMAGKEAEFHVYPQARHGFNCWARADHAPAAALLAHGRTLGFLARQVHGAA